MKVKVLIVGIFLTLCTQKCLTQDVPSIKCDYLMSDSKLKCNLSIYNPKGYNSFQKIEGNPSKSNSEVTLINGYGSISSQNLPSIVCNTFQYTDEIDIHDNVIEKIEAGAFSGCKSLTYLYLYNNKISSVDENAFEGLENLDVLDLHSNEIAELPIGVFKSATLIRVIRLNDNLIEVIDSGVFSDLTNLKQVLLHDNKINALCPESLRNLQIVQLNLARNECINENYFSVPYAKIEESLQPCFENYQTLPRRCGIKNINHKVCELDGVIGDYGNEIHELRKIVEELVEEVNELKG